MPNETTPTLESILMDNGYSIRYRNRLTLAPDVFRAFADGAAKVAVFCEGSADGMASALAAVDGVEVLRVMDKTYSQVRAHVTNAAKTRKITISANPIADADGNAVAVVFSK